MLRTFDEHIGIAIQIRDEVHILLIHNKIMFFYLILIKMTAKLPC
jgi:hypothetical protein